MGHSWEPDLEGLSKAQLDALARDLTGAGRKSVGGADRGRGKIKSGRRKGSLAKLERLDGVGLNQTLVIEIELPGYFVAAMNQRGFSYREAVQEYLLRRGQTWWQPRFMAAIKAKEIEAWARREKARGGFTE